jgi:hypothetical protein
MGSTTFFIKQRGQYKSVGEAFNEAKKEAELENGTGGYSGTIAEKTDFEMVDVPKGADPFDFASECMDLSEGKLWDDKHGPAGCVEVTGEWLKKERGVKFKGRRNFHVYYFFGWASC